MTKEEAKEFYPILQAYAEGKVIECRTKPSAMKGADTPNDWTEMKEIEFWRNIEYRIKPEPNYRPFKNTEECWKEMQKHQPFGWIKDKNDGHYSMVTTVDAAAGEGKKHIYISGGNIWTLSETMCDYTFADGTPFGIKVEDKEE